MDEDYLEKPATPDGLRELAHAKLLSADGLDKGLGILGVYPNRAAWAKFLDIGLLILGASFIVSGIISFFAFNWADMDRFMKFGLLGILILAGVGYASLKNIKDLPAKISLTAAATIVGVLIAIIDQSYPSGAGGSAESYRLFFGWAILIAGWVAIARFIPMWFLLLAIVNAGIAAYWNQQLGRADVGMYILLFLLNTSTVVAWELSRRAEIEWVKNRWMPRIVALAAFLYILTPTMEYIFDLGYSYRDKDASLAFAPILFLFACGGTLYFYSQLKKDLFILSTSVFSLIAVITAYIIQGLDFDSEGLFLVIAIAILAQTALAVRWLRKVDESQEVAS